MASRRFTCPLIRFAKVGEQESAEERKGVRQRLYESILRVCPNRQQLQAIMRTFEVGHERLRAAVQRVDDHLPICGAGDLDAPVLQARRGGRAEPGGVRADVRGLGEEVERLAGIEALLRGLAGDEEGLAGGLEGAVEGGDELERVLGEDLALCVRGLGGVDLHALDHVGERAVEVRGSEDGVWGTAGYK